MRGGCDSCVALWVTTGDLFWHVERYAFWRGVYDTYYCLSLYTDIDI